MEQLRILWVDDEVDSLKAHVMMLEKKGYVVDTAANAESAIDAVRDHTYDAILLDEHMPGRTGLDCLPDLKALAPQVPVVMITKSEEDGLMEEAIGESIADYLLKPVQPRQVLASLTRVLGGRKLVESRSLVQYQMEFGRLTADIATASSWSDWVSAYQSWLRWERRLTGADAEAMRHMLAHQRDEANRLFTRFWADHYPDWISSEDAPCDFSHQIMDRHVAPLLEQGRKVVLVVIDNLRMDQWHELQPIFTEHFRIEDEQAYAAMLPTATQYARNALFSGMLPRDLAKLYPNRWVKDVSDAESGRNAHEGEFLEEWAARREFSKPVYGKLSNPYHEQKWVDQWAQKRGADLTAVVVNFVDRISHAKTEQSIVREIATDDRGFRALTHSWLKNSPLRAWMRQLAEERVDVIITTDHGTLAVDHAVSIKGPREVAANLRYKVGRGLSYRPKDVALEIDPESIGIPSVALGDKAVFAGKSDYFVYPTQYHKYAGQFDGSYQHGGISMEEVIVPIARLSAK